MDDGARMTLWSLVSRSTCGSLVSIFCFSLFRSWWWYTGDGDVGLEVNMFLGYTGESDGGVINTLWGVYTPMVSRNKVWKVSSREAGEML